MVQDLCDNIGIVGAGPAGCCCAYFIKKFNPNANVTLFDYSSPMRTILPTGGGRCNLAHSIYDFKELAKNYPRGEKFLYSVFSRFSTAQTLELFKQLGIPTYTQDDNRIFPVSNSSKEVREKFIKALNNVSFIKEKVLGIEKHNDFKLITGINSYRFDKIVFSTGGYHSESGGYDILKHIGISMAEPKPSLSGFVTGENFKSLMGTPLKNVYNPQTGLSGDILFTHFGLSGPLIYQISSIKARDEFPFFLTFDLIPFELNLQELFNINPHKFIKNLLSEYIPQKAAEYILNLTDVSSGTKCSKINGKTRDKLDYALHHFTAKIISTRKDGETVTSGGVNLNKINPKTMCSKEVDGLYFCGEIIDADGFCGGFNLQNCWSTAYIAASAIGIRG